MAASAAPAPVLLAALARPPESAETPLIARRVRAFGTKAHFARIAIVHADAGADDDLLVTAERHALHVSRLVDGDRDAPGVVALSCRIGPCDVLAVDSTHVLATMDNEVQVIDVASGTWRCAYAGHRAATLTMVLARPPWAATIDMNGEAHVWHRDTGERASSWTDSSHLRAAAGGGSLLVCSNKA